ncbi:hypothetical protein EXIGLDRAFT_716728, partial [Exidia glandulosa HHB12029]
MDDAARLPRLPVVGHHGGTDPTAHAETTVGQVLGYEAPPPTRERQHDPTNPHTAQTTTTGGSKPSMMQKAQGTVEEVIGKVTHSPAKVEAGKAKKEGVSGP